MTGSGTKLGAARAGVRAHDHAVCAYATEEEMRAALGAFVNEGIEARDLVVFVHSFGADEEAWRFLRAAAPGAAPDDVFVVSLYHQAFEGSAGRIDFEHVQRVIGGLIVSARERGRSGTRIFVDASRRYLEGGRADEWFAFEEWLGRRLQASVGLVCAYRREDIMDERVLPRVLDTHAYRFGV